MKYFLDTSSLVKIYHKEEGTDEVINIYKSSKDIVISELSILEFTSTVYRKLREKEIDKEILDILFKRFHYDIDNRYEVLVFSPIVIEEAVWLIHKHGKTKALRSLDSIQLAFFEIYCNDEDIFVCSDIRLSEIVKSEGYNILVAL